MTISTLKLYQITDEYIRAIEQILQPEEDHQLIIDEIKDSFENKCIAVAKYIKGLEAEYSAVKEAANAMAARAKSLEKHAESLTEYLRFNIEKTGLCDSIKSIEFDIRLQQNPPAVMIYDESLVPDVYKVKKEVISIDKISIKKDIDSGFEVEGCRIESKKRLVIK